MKVLSSHLADHQSLFRRIDIDLGNTPEALRPTNMRIVDYLIEDPFTKTLISGPSNSPEQGGHFMGPSMDHRIIRSLFSKASIAAAGCIPTCWSDDHFGQEWPGACPGER
jgi:hypothetical protein